MLSIRRLCTRNAIQLFLEVPSGQVPYSRCSIPLLNKISQPNLQLLRYKSKGNKSNIPSHATETETEKDSSDDTIDDLLDKSTKTIKINVPSMRMDALLKAGMGLSRNKIEVMFYESKVRLNGEKVPKKSITVQEGDEIDMIKGVNVDNPNFLTVARLEILSSVQTENKLTVKIRRCKSLTVEDYSGRNSWVS
uniref:Mitochondrial transcription rescue factor 1 C-terminal domain-containing protein n=1 Tax=Phaedon cochleariae TaxID=80249 RepID=A0A9P0DN54_PHACE|nr:unnamed protein product [Phaedon cochleariae]